MYVCVNVCGYMRVCVCVCVHVFSAYLAAPNMSKLPKTAVFFHYKSIKSS